MLDDVQIEENKKSNILSPLLQMGRLSENPYCGCRILIKDLETTPIAH